MFLQNKLKISEEEAARLRQVLKRRELLLDLQNSNFLCRDLATLKENYANQKDSFGKRIGPVTKALGSFVVPAFDIKLRSLYEGYAKNPKAGELQELQFLCGPSAHGLPILPGVSIYLREAKNHKLQFWDGEFCLQNLQAKEFITGKILFELACFFHNRRELYAKIQEVLEENFSEFEDITTPEFAKDLLLLFSAKDNLGTVKSFKINFAATEEKKVSTKFIRNNRAWLERMTCYIKSPGEGKGYFSRLQTEVWLDQKNILIFNTYEENCTNQKIEVEAYSGAKAFIVAEANNMLNQLVTSTNFQAAIYEKVKTKIFLENL